MDGKAALAERSSLPTARLRLNRSRRGREGHEHDEGETLPRMLLRYIREAEALEDHAGAAFL